MRNTLFEGDFVVINKMRYGARVPITPLALKLGGEKWYVESVQFPYLRLPGYDKIQRGDIIAFNHSLSDEDPVDMREEFIKRCVALPGDTISIRDGEVYVDQKKETRKLACFLYELVVKSPLDSAFLSKVEVTHELKTAADRYSYQFSTDSETIDNFQKIPGLIAITQKKLPKDYFPPTVFPNSSFYKWNQENFGPLYVPKSGDSILLDHASSILYQRMIERFEMVKFQMIGDKYYIDNLPCRYYKFKRNYFFLLGDNQPNSIDSRIFGFVPEDHIIGKASMVLFSILRTNREFLKIK